MKVTNSYLDDFSSDFLSVVVDFLTSDEDFPVDLVGSRLLDRASSIFLLLEEEVEAGLSADTFSGGLDESLVLGLTSFDLSSLDTFSETFDELRLFGLAASSGFLLDELIEVLLGSLLVDLKSS